MHAFILGKDVGFSAGRFYGGVADLLAGVEEEEGYVVDGRWVGWAGREERRKNATEMLTRTEQAASDNAGSVGTLRRTASDKERSRMEEVLQSTPSLPSPSSPSSPCAGEDVEVRLEVQRRRQTIVASESESPLEEDAALQRNSDQEYVAPGLDSSPKSGQWDKGTTGSQEREDDPTTAGKR